MRRILSCLAAAILCICTVVFTSCAASKPYSEGGGELRVVCTTFVPFDFARIVGGDKVSVTLLQDNGSDMHNYTPTTATLETIADADIFIYIGGESDEQWVPNALRAAENNGLEALCLMDCIKEPLHAELQGDWNGHEHTEFESDTDGRSHAEHESEHGGHEHHADEHIWTSLKNAISMVDAIKDSFISARPESEAGFTSRASAYIERLSALDAEYASAVESARIKSVAVADRFPFIYLFHDYKISYLAAFGGCSTEVNSSFETQVSLINKVKESGAKYVLTIEGSDKALADAVSREVGCSVLSLNSLQSVKRSEIESGTTYIDVMRSNLEILREVLG